VKKCLLIFLLSLSASFSGAQVIFTNPTIGIQAALTACPTNCTIYVQPGVYSVNAGLAMSDYDSLFKLDSGEHLIALGSPTITVTGTTTYNHVGVFGIDQSSISSTPVSNISLEGNFQFVLSQSISAVVLQAGASSLTPAVSNVTLRDFTQTSQAQPDIVLST
jgi:hypothetical protein